MFVILLHVRGASRLSKAYSPREITLAIAKQYTSHFKWHIKWLLKSFPLITMHAHAFLTIIIFQ